MKTWLLLAGVVALCGCEEKKPPLQGPAVASSAPATSAASSVAAAAPPSASSAPVEISPPDAIAAQHVLVAYKGAKNAPKSVTRSKDEAKARAQQVATAAKTGDFTALVNEFSDDEATKGRQGSLGKFTRDKMVKPFSDVAFALKVGQASDPVETPFGFHVIKRNQ